MAVARTSRRSLRITSTAKTFFAFPFCVFSRVSAVHTLRPLPATLTFDEKLEGAIRQMVESNVKL